MSYLNVFSLLSEHENINYIILNMTYLIILKRVLFAGNNVWNWDQDIAIRVQQWTDQKLFTRRAGSVLSVKVPITPKSFFRLNKYLHLFETHCAFLPLFSQNIDILQAVKVTKSGHHLSHDRASKGYGSIPCLTSQTSLHACLQRLTSISVRDIKQGIDPCPLLARSCDWWWLDFETLTT